MRMSISTTSGRSRRGHRDRLVAVGRFADDLDVVLGVEQRRKPARTSAWSSASTTRITGGHGTSERDAGAHPEAAVAIVPDLEFAAERVHALAHADDALAGR